MNATIIVSDWKPVERNSLRGFCMVSLPSGLILHDVSVYCKDSRWWASPASKPMLDRDGKAMRGEDWKIKYLPIVSFASKEIRDRFSEQVIEALRQTTLVGAL